jgi:Dyp-type peroxidase family
VESAAEFKSKLKSDPTFKPQEAWLHISLSIAGIQKLQLPPVYSRGVYVGPGRRAKIIDPDPSNRDAMNVQELGDPFIGGMKSRAEKLKDTGVNSPENWDEPYKSKEIDALFIIAGDQENDVDNFAIQLVAEAAQIGCVCVGMEIGKALFNEQGKQVEHFGFRDGISQPLIRGFDKHDRKVYIDEFDPEDFILFGLKDNPATGEKLSWANHGSFLVFRKLEQDVMGFWDEMIAASNARSVELCENKADPEEKFIKPEELAAMFVGRWKSGAPLVESPHFDPVRPEQSDFNDFLYCHKSNLDGKSYDPEGQVTPIFSHIRVANSRDDDIEGGGKSPAQNRKANNMHRILRRGIPYGPPWARDAETNSDNRRGMLFLCYQRDIEQQFEHIQTSWWRQDIIYKDKKHGCIIDLLAGASPKYFSMGLERWVETKGGGYFFSPSIHALQHLEEYVLCPS